MHQSDQNTALSRIGRVSLGPVAKIEWHQRRPDAHLPFLVKRMSWAWLSAELVRLQPTELKYRVKGDAAYLALHDFVRSDGETTINGGSRSTLTDLRDKLTFAPIGSSVEGWNCFKGRMSSVFAVHLAPPTSDQSASDISNIPPSLYFEHSNLKATLQKLQSALDGSGIDDHAYAETLGLLLLWELRHAADSKYSQLNPVRGGLTVLQLRRIKDFVDAHISKVIGVSDLANLLGLSQFHFIRAFKHSVGLSPYQYVLSERINVAKEILSKSDLSMADVALAAGFSDASQLNRVFRKLVGVTPTAFRRESG
ncbi:AraC family transcriptional regulator [Bradyrhizobium barranii subsp. apii]|uniref:AraC family transcriptional regulator n=1 Tax=Bradyrhizobium barranii subsp. apii TaxID=2819348 RepID=A0A8T5VG42_9BRAD|nr:AraC family transcriptional regulator [Bradyrhizobium barranii]UPT88722.1 AraC family transcriptional regulator [Bradyrhizobium barranii subsp. apii]